MPRWCCLCFPPWQPHLCNLSSHKIPEESVAENIWKCAHWTIVYGAQVGMRDHSRFWGKGINTCAPGTAAIMREYTPYSLLYPVLLTEPGTPLTAGKSHMGYWLKDGMTECTLLWEPNFYPSPGNFPGWGPWAPGGFCWYWVGQECPNNPALLSRVWVVLSSWTFAREERLLRGENQGPRRGYSQKITSLSTKSGMLKPWAESQCAPSLTSRWA
jgi:hypothetical protein